MTVDTRRFTKRKQPSAPYEKIADAILPGWEISLVFAGADRAQALNQELRNKDYVPNVLSYESGKKSGEIIICLTVAEKQAPTYGMSYSRFVAFLFIHGLTHLKGMRHGATMEKYERAQLARFLGTTSSPSHLTLHGSTHRNRNRHRNTPDKGGHSRGGRDA